MATLRESLAQEPAHHVAKFHYERLKTKGTEENRGNAYNYHVETGYLRTKNTNKKKQAHQSNHPWPCFHRMYRVPSMRGTWTLPSLTRALALDSQWPTTRTSWQDEAKKKSRQQMSRISKSKKVHLSKEGESFCASSPTILLFHHQCCHCCATAASSIRRLPTLQWSARVKRSPVFAPFRLCLLHVELPRCALPRRHSAVPFMPCNAQGTSEK